MMKFIEGLKNDILFLDEKDNDRILRKYFLSRSEANYVFEYLKNEKDCAVKASIDNEILLEEERINSLISYNDIDKSIGSLIALNEPNNSVVNYELGYLICKKFNGNESSKEFHQGIDLILKSAMQDNPRAQRFLAEKHYNGLFQSRPLSAFWLFKAAINGDNHAQWDYPDNLMGGNYGYYTFNNDLLEMLIVSAESGEYNAQNRLLHNLLDKNFKEGKYFDKERGLALAKQYSRMNSRRHYYDILNIIKEYGFSEKDL